MQTNVIRRIDVRATTSGVDESRRQLVQFGAAQTDAASSAGELERAMQKTQRAMDLNNRMYLQAIDAQRAAAAANDNFAQSSSGVGAALRIATKAAVDQGTSYLIAAGKATAFAFAAAAVATILGGLYLIYKAVATAIGLVTDAWEFSGQKLAEYTKIARDAASVDLSNGYFQRIAKAAADSKVPVDTLIDAIKKLNEAAVEKLGGSTLQKTVKEHLEAGNFKGNTGVAGLLSANNGDERLKAMIALLDQAMAKGERLAAMDLLGKAMGPAAVESFRKNADYFRNIEESAVKIAAKELVPDAEIARALELERRFNAAAEILSQRWHPLQALLTELGIKMREAWVDIVEQIAFAVDGAAKLAGKIAEVPQSFWDYVKKGANAAGTAFMEATTTPESRKAAEKSFGISSDTGDMADLAVTNQRSAAIEQLKAKMLGLNAIERAGIEAQTVYNAVRKDTSKTLEKETEQTKDVADAYDRAIEAVSKHTARLRADTLAVGLGAGALEEYRARSQLTVAAQIAGREPTAALTAEIEKQARAAGQAGAALARMRVGDQLKFDRQTAFLSPEDLQIAQQLRSIYGSDVPAALASSEASAMRFNNQLKSINDIARSAVSSFATDLVAGLRNGESAMAAIGHAAQNLSAQLTNSAITELLKGNFVGAAVSGIGALISGIVGNNQKKKDEALAAAKAAAERMEGYAARAATAGLDTSSREGALQQFEIQAMQQRLQEQKAGGQAMAALEQALAAERAAIVDRFNKQDADAQTAALAAKAQAEKASYEASLKRQQDYQDRLFATTLDTSTIGGALAAFDRKAEKERADELAAGGQQILLLVATQEAERYAIYKKFNEDSIKLAQDAADAQKKNLQAVQQFIDQIGKTIRDYLNGLRTGASSTLSAQDRLNAAQSQFGAQFALAQAGDRTALGTITQYSQTLLDAAKGFFASSSGYTSIFNDVTAKLQSIPENLTVSQVTAADLIVAAINESKAATVSKIGSTTLETIVAANSNNAALSSTITTVNGQTVQTITTSNGQVVSAVTDAKGNIVSATATQTSALGSAIGGTTGAVNTTGASNDNLTAAQNALIASQNALASQQVTYIQTTNSLLAAIQSLQSTSSSSLTELRNLQAATITVTGSNVVGERVVSNTMITALNKIAFNTAFQLNPGGNSPVALVGSYRKGGVIPGYESGGVVGNGLWDRDSVLARYAGGGHIALAGGEYVMPASETRQFMPLLDAMRNGSFGPAPSNNDNGSREIGMALNRMAELQSRDSHDLREEMANQTVVMKGLVSKLTLLLAAA